MLFGPMLRESPRQPHQVHVDLDACGLDKGGVMGVATVTGFAVVMGYTGRVHTSCISHLQ